MRAKLRETPARGEVSDGVERHSGDMKETKVDLERDVRDLEITRETLDALEKGGTSEGCGEVLKTIEGAETLTERVFDTDGEKLQEIHRESDESKTDLQDRSESVGRDAERIGDACGVVDIADNVRELRQARDHAVRDREFLERHIEALDAALAQSEADYEHLQGRVHSKGGS